MKSEGMQQDFSLELFRNELFWPKTITFEYLCAFYAMVGLARKNKIMKYYIPPNQCLDARILCNYQI